MEAGMLERPELTDKDVIEIFAHSLLECLYGQDPAVRAVGGSLRAIEAVGDSATPTSPPDDTTDQLSGSLDDEILRLATEAKLKQR